MRRAALHLKSVSIPTVGLRLEWRIWVANILVTAVLSIVAIVAIRVRVRQHRDDQGRRECASFTNAHERFGEHIFIR